MKNRNYIVSLIVVVLLVALSILGLTVLGAVPKLGLDLRGGLSVVLTAEGSRVDEGVLDRTVEIIRNRVDSIGAQEPDISRSGDRNIIVQLPGVRDPARALEIIGKTAQLRFREVLDSTDVAEAEADARKRNLRSGTAAFDRAVADFMAEKGWTITTDDPPDKEVVFRGHDNRLFKLGRAELTGEDVADAFAQPPSTTGTWQVQLDLNGRGADRFAAVTQRLAPQGASPGGLLAIVLDRFVESSPQVQSPIDNGRAQITGNFTDQEAKDLALVLKTGALPIELERSQVQRVSATLGTASLRAGLLAGAIGLALVALYMFAFYRLLGLVTFVGLGIFGALVLGIMGFLSQSRGFSLTLAGIAGLIVSVGIAADTYIIYFERVKDELKGGKTFRSAVERGYKSALRTNVTANTVAFAAALILWLLAVGPVRGFALTLGISVLLDIFLLYAYTHPLVALISRNSRISRMRSVGMREASREQVPVV
jgi:preprotein translocase subunit SecD